MALDKTAGQKRSVSAMRNFRPVEVVSTPVASEVVKPAVETFKNLEAPTYSRKSEEIAKAPMTIEAAPAKSRHRKVSFFTSQETEERFKKARLRAGFEKLEDAYNRALEHFILSVEKGEIDEF